MYKKIFVENNILILKEASGSYNLNKVYDIIQLELD
jgi:hypothetical protein